MPRARRQRRAGKGIFAMLRGRARRTGPAEVPDIVANLTQARGALVAHRTELDNQIAAVDRALAVMGAARPTRGRAARRPALRLVGARGRRRGRSEGTLKEHIARVMKGNTRPMAVKDITAAVRRSGYATTNKTLAKSVGVTLTQMPQVMKVNRGLFRMK